MGRENGVSREVVWRRRLARFGRRNWTVAEFCRREGVSIPTFYHWRKRLGFAAGKLPARDVQGQPAQAQRDTRPFVAVSVAAPAIAEIEFPNGVRIRVPAANVHALRAAMRRTSSVPGGGGAMLSFPSNVHVYVNIEQVSGGRIAFSACNAHARRYVFNAREQHPELSSQILALYRRCMTSRSAAVVSTTWLVSCCAAARACL